ncbi:DUF2294 domain-containing protein [Fischerella thermalis]|jgi:uncharacterized protein YbcI|uniref:Na+-translocating membrane potential-generating system MpsC domain-containing protein n=1 Tax=Fischerella thermalis JSC-11 TaxID=741277 RepID=G6FMH1_9CYAN|nr:DUF2294 domain-containing protein [Fischerella thermalis]PMB03739.1 DUF2294 domain-containing protein [Fischerella thermalis CCMEE 5328]PMB04204.1 DUF2294 domain-containing protein [Fischerella thermalis CCMEE 5273]EHC19251.1 Protein of unknown function DUF2294 [Fischerella thermalis JSC-11]MBF1989203.1 DUF2294 domain-containing protein [Fischerella thermalis M58_A2018_009]MBF2062298.1 DUF2294 domain-containing protein [Fischerella thermalis M66_A2018_004]
MAESIPTRGQVERTLAQRIQALYREQLGHQPSKVTSRLSETNVVIVIENSITPPEQLLAQTGRQELAEQVRSDLDEAIQPQLKELIEEILHVSVVEILSDATLETGRSGIIAILSDTPDLRDSVSNSKIRKKAS